MLLFKTRCTFLYTANQNGGAYCPDGFKGGLYKFTIVGPTNGYEKVWLYNVSMAHQLIVTCRLMSPYVQSICSICPTSRMCVRLFSVDISCSCRTREVFLTFVGSLFCWEMTLSSVCTLYYLPLMFKTLFSYHWLQSRENFWEHLWILKKQETIPGAEKNLWKPRKVYLMVT